MTVRKVVYGGRLYVIAQDPPPAAPGAPVAEDVEDPLAEEAPVEDAPAEGAPGGEAPAGEDPFGGAFGDEPASGDDDKVEDPEKLIKEINESPAANWRDYLQPIIRDLKVRFNDQPITLRNPEMTSETGDFDLGFYITGYVHFVNGVPPKLVEEFGHGPLHFKVFVDGDGKLHREHIEVYTELG